MDKLYDYSWVFTDVITHIQMLTTIIDYRATLPLQYLTERDNLFFYEGKSGIIPFIGRFEGFFSNKNKKRFYASIKGGVDKINIDFTIPFNWADLPEKNKRVVSIDKLLINIPH